MIFSQLNFQIIFITHFILKVVIPIFKFLGCLPTMLICYFVFNKWNQLIFSFRVKHMCGSFFNGPDVIFNFFMRKKSEIKYKPLKKLRYSKSTFTKKIRKQPQIKGKTCAMRSFYYSGQTHVRGCFGSFYYNGKSHVRDYSGSTYSDKCLIRPRLTYYFFPTPPMWLA